MESLSGPLHSRKLSNGNGFSSKNAYDGLFLGQKKFGAPIFPTRTEDYREIFGSSQEVSSIPVLDLSGFHDPNGSSNLRSSKPDYSNIFGGFRDDDDGAASYEELFGRLNGVKNSPEKARATSARRQPSRDSEDLFDTSNQSADELKQFNVSYHKTIQMSKDGSNGTTHVAQLCDVPGFTCFIDEIKMSSSLKAEPETTKCPAVNDIHPKSDGIPEVKNSKKGNAQTFGNAVKSKSRYSRDGSFSDDKLFNANEINVKSHPSKSPSPSFIPSNSENHQARSNGPVASNLGAPENDVCESDEELDVNSAAAASVAALKKAIEKAQESIRIAKESVGRKKEGLQSFSNKSFKDSLKVKGCEATNKNVFDLTERKNAFKGVVGSDFKDGEKLFVARKVIDEMHGKISELAGQSKKSPWSPPGLKESEGVPVSREVRDETSGRNKESVEKIEASSWSIEPPFSENIIFETVDYHESKTTSEALEDEGFVKKLGAVENSSEGEDTEWKPDVEVRVHGLESGCHVDEERENELPSSKQEEQEVMEKPQGFFKLVNFVKSLRGFVETTEDDKRVSDKLKDDYEARVNEAHNFFEDENKLKYSREMIENEQKDREERVDQALENFEIWMEQEEVLEESSIEKAENENEHGKECDRNENEKISEEVSQWVENEPGKFDVSNGSEKEDTHKEEAIEKWVDEVHELEIDEKEQPYVHDVEEGEVGLQDEFKIKQDDNQKGEETEKFSEERDANDEKDNEETLNEKSEWEEKGEDDVFTEDYIYKERETTASLTDGNEENKEIEIPQTVDYEEMFGRDFENINPVEIQDTCKIEVDYNKVETGLEANDSSRRPETTNLFSELKEEEPEVVEFSNRVQENDIFEEACRTSTEDDEREFVVKEVVNEAFSSNGDEGNYGFADKEVGVNEFGQTDEQSYSTSDGTEAVSTETVKIEELIKEEVKHELPQEEKKLFPKRAHWDLERSRLPSIPKEKEQTFELKDDFKRSQYREKTENLSRSMEDKKDEEIKVKKVVEEKKQIKDLDEETKRQREREKDRMVVERAIREARERAFTEARERAERAAVERATEEVRQRVMAEAREKIERVSAGMTKERAAVERATEEVRQRVMAEAREKIERVSAGITKERAAVERATEEVRQRVMAEAREKIERVSAGMNKSSSEKGSAEARIRAERAAVERATAEARERALEKAMSQKTTASVRSVAEKVAGGSRDTGIRQSSSADLHGSSGTNSESALRSKARMERHNRIMERAAKALAEKEHRDLLAQREQAERNRLAETLDAEIKRWSSGKQGNLRALLSTLQYILGSNSGWQPVSLTEIITTSAVKKAYRKATLVVHPDKVQQRGASIQQKYICEKVFDLLKAAWNRFNSEER